MSRVVKSEGLQVLTAWCVLLSFFALSLLGGGVFVLCVGEEGHIALEIAHDGTCRSSIPASSKEKINSGLELSPWEGHYGNCHDIPVTTDSARQQPLLAQKVLLTHLIDDNTQLADTPAYCPEFEGSAQLPNQPAVSPHTLDSIHTVILLI